MKKTVFVCALSPVMAVMAACGDLLEPSGNGKLDGWWRLTAIDTLATGGRLDMGSGRKMAAFQGRILEMKDADVGPRLMFRFVLEGDRLTLSDPRCNDRQNGDPAVGDMAVLRPFGVNSMEETFKVERLSRTEMILAGSMLRLRYTKF